MNYNGTIYRPPVEAGTLLIPVTEGCTHNSCSFCNMYQDVPFRIWQLDEIEKYMKDIMIRYNRLVDRIERVYFVGADPFALSMEKLLERIDLIKRYLPKVSVVTMYARTDNIAHKSDEDLRVLKDAGVNDLYIGVECGLNDVLDDLNKGYSADETREQCLRLNAVGIRHCDLLMLGTAGKGRGLQAAKATAELENEIRPTKILINTMSAFEGTALDADIRDGRFTPATEKEILQEEYAFLNALELPDTYFWAIHPLDSVGIEGVLRTDKNRMLQKLGRAIETVDNSAYNRVSRRGTL